MKVNLTPLKISRGSSLKKKTHKVLKLGSWVVENLKKS